MDQRSTNAAATPTLLIHKDTSINSVVSYDRAFASMTQNTHNSPPIPNTTADQPNSLTSASTASSTDLPTGSPVAHGADDTFENFSYEEHLVNTSDLDLPSSWGQGSRSSDQAKVSGLEIRGLFHV
jgi:hypothetical protein